MWRLEDKLECVYIGKFWGIKKISEKSLIKKVKSDDFSD